MQNLIGEELWTSQLAIIVMTHAIRVLEEDHQCAQAAKKAITLKCQGNTEPLEHAFLKVVLYLLQSM